ATRALGGDRQVAAAGRADRTDEVDGFVAQRLAGDPRRLVLVRPERDAPLLADDQTVFTRLIVAHSRYVRGHASSPSVGRAARRVRARRASACASVRIDPHRVDAERRVFLELD